MLIEWADPALDDLEGIRDYIGKDSPYCHFTWTPTLIIDNYTLSIIIYPNGFL